MTDQEINRALALAIGWPAGLVEEAGYACYVCIEIATLDHNAHWRAFDYRHCDVIWPIAERYNRFPYALRGKDGAYTGKWNVLVDGGEHTADSAAKAVALAVIGLTDGRVK